MLRNLLGVTSRAEMDTLEAQALLLAQARFFDRLDLSHSITTSNILSMHREWLEGIYPFAGKLRTLDIGKGNIWFASTQFLESTFTRFGDEILPTYTPCTAATVEVAASAMAAVHGEFIAIHPFREGNGRVGRWIADAMALQAGLPFPHYGFEVDANAGTNRAYLAAIKLAIAKADNLALTQFFVEALRRAL